MAQSIYVRDDSPLVAYFPLVNLEPSPNITAGWQLLYTGSGAATAPGEVGNGTSSHRTSLDGASLAISWTGTGIDLLGTVHNALYDISLDGNPANYSADRSPGVLASLSDLDHTNHSLLLTTIITNATSPDAFLAFDMARVTYDPPAGSANSTYTAQTIADADIAYMGLWSYVPDSAGNAMHVSRSAGDRASASFQGSAITIYGLTSSYSGNFTVILDNTTTTLSALSSYNNSDTLLFYATNLSQDMAHHIAVVNQENRTLGLRIGGLNTTSFGNTTSSPAGSSGSASSPTPAGTIAAAVLAAILFLLVAGIIYYACWVRRRTTRAVNLHPFPRGGRESPHDRVIVDLEQVAYARPSSGEELESTSLSTSKGYGFGLGIRRGFPFAYRKNKMGSSSSGRLANGTGTQAESHQMTPQYDRDEKRLSIYTLTEDPPHALESEKLAPGWSNPVARTPPSFKYTRCYKDVHGVLLPELRGPIGLIDDMDDDDADVKTLTSRQDEALAATLLLSPRTSEAVAAGTMQSQIDQQLELLQVRTTSPFRVDVSAIIGPRKGDRGSSRTSGSAGSTWSKVRARLYRKAHRDDGRSSTTDKQEASSSSGPESVPVVMHESGSAKPPSETTPGSGTYSFLDLTSSHVSLRRYSKTTLSSAPAELGHGAREASAWSDNTSIKVARAERSRDDMAPKPDAPSTASGGSHPSDNSATHTVPSAPTTHTQMSSAFPFPITIPPSTHIAPPTAPPSEDVPERRSTPSPPHTPPPTRLDQYLQVPQIAPPELVHSPAATSPTESVPFSVSDIHFRHSFSDYTGLDSQRASVSSGLPPHPPLPRIPGSQTTIHTYSPPPPYIVQRVLGLPISPLSPMSPLALSAGLHTPTDSPTSPVSSITRPGTAPNNQLAPFRVGSLLGPRPRPSTAGSVRGSASPQLPLQGGRGGLRSPREGDRRDPRG